MPRTEAPLVGPAVEDLATEQDHAGAGAEGRHAPGQPLGDGSEQAARPSSIDIVVDSPPGRTSASTASRCAGDRTVMGSAPSPPARAGPRRPATRTPTFTPRGVAGDRGDRLHVGVLGLVTAHGPAYCTGQSLWARIAVARGWLRHGPPVRKRRSRRGCSPASGGSRCVTTWAFAISFRAHGQGRPSRRRLAALLAVGLAAGACSSGGDDAGPQDARATFDRADGAALEFEDPVTTVADLLPPEDSKDAWMIAGSVFDPKSSTSVATTWVSGDGEDPGRSARPATPASRSRRWSATRTAPWPSVGWATARPPTPPCGARTATTGRGSARRRRRRPNSGAFDVAASDAGVLVAGGESAWGGVPPRLWFSPDGDVHERRRR